MNRILRHVDRNDFKKTLQRQIDEQKKLAAQKLKECQKVETERKQIEEIAKPYKSDWREETQLQESDWTPVAGSIANSSSQTFQYGGGGGPTARFSGLGGVEAYPSTVTVSGETLNTPDYSQLGLQGYAPPVGGIQRQTQQTENERIDAEIIKLEEQIKQLQQKISDLNKKQIATEPQYTGMSHGDYIDKTNEINDKWNEKTGPLGEIIYGSSSDSEKKAAYAKLDVYERARIKELDALDAEYKNQTDEHSKAQNDHFAAYTAKVDSALAKQEAFRVKIAELEKQRPTNQQLDAAQQVAQNANADVFMGARVEPAVGTTPITTSDERFIANLSLLPTMVNLFSPGSGAAGTLALQYAKGDMTPVTRSPGTDFDKGVLNMIDTSLTRGNSLGQVSDNAYTGDMPFTDVKLSDPNAVSQAPIRASLGQFNYEITSNGIRVIDKFNFNKNTSTGILKMIPGMQQTADRLVDIGNRRAIKSGQNPTSDNYGIPIDYTIPWSKVPPQLQNKLDPNQRLVPIVRRKKKVDESTTWSRLKK